MCRQRLAFLRHIDKINTGLIQRDRVIGGRNGSAVCGIADTPLIQHSDIENWAAQTFRHIPPESKT